MIIAWYPGAGGNRFYRHLQGQQTFVANQGYDQLNPFQDFKNRYPTNDADVNNHLVIFTHCVNYDLIVKKWPDHGEIYFISADLGKSLRRQWALFQQNVSENQHPVGGPFSTIVWHHKYYTCYPWHPGAGTVVDSSTFLDFSEMLSQELDSIICPEFDFAQSMFDQHGINAPILDLYNQYYD